MYVTFKHSKGLKWNGCDGPKYKQIHSDKTVFCEFHERTNEHFYIQPKSLLNLFSC